MNYARVLSSAGVGDHDSHEPTSGAHVMTAGGTMALSLSIAGL